MVASGIKCANHSRRGPQGPLTRAVFLLGARSGDGPRCLTGPARVVERGVGRVLGLLVRARQTRVLATAVAVEYVPYPAPGPYGP